PGVALQHAFDDQLDAFVARSRLFGRVDEANDLATQGDGQHVEHRQRTWSGAELGGQVGWDRSFARLGVQQHRYFDGSSGIDAESAPDLTVDVHAVVATAARYQSVLKRQTFDPAVHRNVLFVVAGELVDGLADIARDVDDPHDPDFMDLGGEDVGGMGRRIHEAPRGEWHSATYVALSDTGNGRPGSFCESFRRAALHTAMDYLQELCR